MIVIGAFKEPGIAVVLQDSGFPGFLILLNLENPQTWNLENEISRAGLLVQSTLPAISNS